MHVRVHRPVVCVVCKAEMAASVADWFHCTTCGAKREWR